MVNAMDIAPGLGSRLVFFRFERQQSAFRLYVYVVAAQIAKLIAAGLAQLTWTPIAPIAHPTNAATNRR